ncbi:MAG: DAK2 domain-containing protein, partial [Myxococcales bacterium]|nr:DAK2 domain-containing protein [Myxococcales bacterium]
MRAVLVATLLAALPAWAEIAPQYYEQMQAEASDVVRLRVTAVKTSLCLGLCESQEVDVTAKVLRVERGKAQVGDKTMLDAIAPAITAMRATLADAGDDVSAGVFLRAAADAAQRGADETASMQSKIGRASWQGERSTGKK